MGTLKSIITLDTFYFTTSSAIMNFPLKVLGYTFPVVLLFLPTAGYDALISSTRG